jgi:hypothetical protein
VRIPSKPYFSRGSRGTGEFNQATCLSRVGSFLANAPALSPNYSQDGSVMWVAPAFGRTSKLVRRPTFSAPKNCIRTMLAPWSQVSCAAPVAVMLCALCPQQHSDIVKELALNVRFTLAHGQCESEESQQAFLAGADRCGIS